MQVNIFIKHLFQLIDLIFYIQPGASYTQSVYLIESNKLIFSVCNSTLTILIDINKIPVNIIHLMEMSEEDVDDVFDVNVETVSITFVLKERTEIDDL